MKLTQQQFHRENLTSDTKMAANASVLNVKSSCNFVINSVRDSLLNYSIQETPFSLYLTIRKTFSQSSPTSTQSFCPNVVINDREIKEVKILKNKLKNLEDSNSILNGDLEEATNDLEISFKRIKELEDIVEENANKAERLEKVKVKEGIEKNEQAVTQLKAEKKILETDLEVSEKNSKKMLKEIKAKDKDIYDLKKEIKLSLKILHKLKLILRILQLK